MESGSRAGCNASPRRRSKQRAHRAVDDDRLVILGDRRKADDLPILLRQHMPDQIVPRVTPEGRGRVENFRPIVDRSFTPLRINLAR